MTSGRTLIEDTWNQTTGERVERLDLGQLHPASLPALRRYVAGMQAKADNAISRRVYALDLARIDAEIADRPWNS